MRQRRHSGVVGQGSELFQAEVDVAALAPGLVTKSEELCGGRSLPAASGEDAAATTVQREKLRSQTRVALAGQMTAQGPQDPSCMRLS